MQLYILNLFLEVTKNIKNIFVHHVLFINIMQILCMSY